MGGSVADLHDVSHVARRQCTGRPDGHTDDSSSRRRHLYSRHAGQFLRDHHRTIVPDVRCPDWSGSLAHLHAFHHHPGALLQAAPGHRKRGRRVRQRRVHHGTPVRSEATPGELRAADYNADNERVVGKPGCVCVDVEAAPGYADRKRLRALRGVQGQLQRERRRLRQMAGKIRELQRVDLEKPVVYDMGRGDGDCIQWILRSVRASGKYEQPGEMPQRLLRCLPLLSSLLLQCHSCYRFRRNRNRNDSNRNDNYDVQPPSKIRHPHCRRLNST